MFWLQVDVQGRAAHGSLYKEGIDANLQMGHLLHALSRYSQALLERPPHPLTGPPSMHASKLSGGTEWSMFAANSTLQLERRMVPGETSDSVMEEYQQILQQVSEEHPAFKAVSSLRMVREPYEIAREAPIVECLQTAAAKVTGAPSPICGRGYWMDSQLFGAAGIPAVIIGPSGGGAHAAVEWVELESVYQLTEILVQTALDFCN
jgi:acetylornithine deacetylase